MIPQIDPLTGDIVWRSDDDKRNTQKEISKKLKENSDIFLKSHDDLNSQYCPRQSKMTLQQRYDTIMSFAHECQMPDELMEILKEKVHPIAYDGFEPSGRMHIAQGILRAINVNKLVDAGVIFIFWVADWFALLNNKMGGDLEKIRNVGRYFIEVWKAAGMKMHNVKFLWASDEINSKSEEYWLRVLDISRKFTNSRIMKCQTIMGRKEEGDVYTAQMIYPLMQCSDIFFLNADITSLGLDQRKVNMLAREYAGKVDIKPPVIISHKMMAGLKEGQEKMSKSDPDSAIFMEDSAEDVERKIRKAFCPDKVIEGNPIIEYASIILECSGKLEVPIYKSTEKKTYTSFDKIKGDFVSGELFAADLKKGVSDALNKLIEPVRQHFKNDPYAAQLLKVIRSYQVTK